MPYLQCPRCHRTAWVRSEDERDTDCRHCGSDMGLMTGSQARHLAAVVRERFAREGRLDPDRPRFMRDPRR